MSNADPQTRGNESGFNSFMDKEGNFQIPCTTKTVPSATTTMTSIHARYFNEMASLMGGHFPTVHYLDHRAFDKFLREMRQCVSESGQEWRGDQDTFHFRGVRIIRTGEP